jgi:hypothetical protein
MPYTIPPGIALDLPDVNVTITPQSEYKVTVQAVDSYRTATVANTRTTVTRNPSIFVDLAASSSYATTASFAIVSAGTASVAVSADSASLLVASPTALEPGLGLPIESGSIVLSGSTTHGILGTTATLGPPIPTASFLGANVDYRAFRSGSARQGILLATWLGDGSNLISFTDASSADIGDTSEISFDFVITGENAHLRMTSTDLSDDDTWTVQTFFRLFPKFPT